jgi:hypothetical protein
MTVVPAGTEVRVTAVPHSGFVLAAWHGACAGTEGDTCTIEPDADASLTVVFAAAFTTSSATSSTTAPASTTAPTDTSPPPSTTVVSTTAPSTSTAPPQPGRPDASDAVAAAVAALPTAIVAFNVPETLGRGQTATIQLLLSPPAQTIGELEQRLTETGDRFGQRVRYSSRMQAVLQSQDFEVTAVDQSPDGVKLVPSDTDTEWLWQVTPKRTGRLRLFLTLYAIVDVAGTEGPVKVKTFRKRITIDVTLRERAEDFVRGNWQWLWTAILVPVGLWLARRRSKPAPPPAGA